MAKDLKISIDENGDITRDADNKHLATVTEEGEIKYSNSAYAKGNYKKEITAIAEAFKDTGAPPKEEEPEPEPQVVEADPRVPSSAPPKDPNLGSFSAAFINYDHANLSDEDFGAKYKQSADCQIDFILRKPELFADRDKLKNRLAAVASA